MATDHQEPGLENLPRRILAHEESAYREFALTFHQQFYRFFRVQGMPDFASEDLAANLMTDIPLKVKAYKVSPDASFKSWVWAIARNTATDWWRARKCTVEIPDNLTEPPRVDSSSAPDVTASIGAVHEALAQLNEVDRQIIELRDLGEVRSYAEIAKLLRINLSAAKTRRTRAKKHLKEILAGDPRIRARVERRRNKSCIKEIT